MPRDLEARLLPVCIPTLKEKRQRVIRQLPAVICLPDRSGGPLPTLAPYQRAALILRGICRKYDIQQKVLLGPSREGIVIEARREACYLIARDTDLTLPAIGKLVRRDHTTVMYSIERHCDTNDVALPRIKKLKPRAGCAS